MPSRYIAVTEYATHSLTVSFRVPFSTAVYGVNEYQRSQTITQASIHYFTAGVQRGTRLVRLIISLRYRRHHHHCPHQHHHHAHAGLVLFSVNGFTENTDNYSIFRERFTETMHKEI